MHFKYYNTQTEGMHIYIDLQLLLRTILLSMYLELGKDHMPQT